MLKNCETLMSERNLFAMEGAWNLIEWSNNDISPCCELTVNSALLCALYALFLASLWIWAINNYPQNIVKNQSALNPQSTNIVGTLLRKPMLTPSVMSMGIHYTVILLNRANCKKNLRRI